MNSFLHLFWDPSPLLLDAGVIKIAWYGMMWAISFMIGYYLVSHFFKLEKIPIKWLDSLVIYMVLGSVIGARLGHCFFYEWDYYISNPMEILFINKGGMASHGGAIGIILVLYIWSRRVSKRSILWVLDRVVIAVALAGALIRFGNFINQEIVGAPSNSSIAVVFPRHDQNTEFRARPADEGIQVSYKAGVQLADDLGVFRTYNDMDLELLKTPWKGKNRDGEPWLELDDKTVKDTCCVTYSLMYLPVRGESMVTPIDSNDTRKVRLQQSVSLKHASLEGHWDGDSIRLSFAWGNTSMEGNFNVSFLESYDDIHWKRLKSADLYKGANGASLTGSFAPDTDRTATYRVALREATDLHYVARHPAQLYEAAAYILVFIFLLFVYFRQKGRIPQGQIFGLFLIFMFTARFLIEFLKENQEAFEDDLTYNMGQLLSIPFFFAGIFLLIRSRRHKPGPHEEIKEEA